MPVIILQLQLTDSVDQQVDKTPQRVVQPKQPKPDKTPASHALAAAIVSMGNSIGEGLLGRRVQAPAQAPESDAMAKLQSAFEESTATNKMTVATLKDIAEILRDLKPKE